MTIDWFLECYEVKPNSQIINKRSGKEIKQYPKKHGYIEVVLCREGKKKHCLLHRLVGKLFVDNPQNLPDINHIDGDRHNNHFLNLEWVTKKQNNQRRVLNKLTSEIAKELKELYEIGGVTQVELAKKYNVNQSHVSRVINNIQWTI